MKDIEQRVLDAIDVDAMLAYLCDLIAIQSLTGDESKAQQHISQKMEALGLAVDVWELDFEALSKHPSYCVEVERNHGLGVVGTLGQTHGQSLILNGHVDVVPAGDLTKWNYPPWQGTIDNHRVYGRGALDMKGGLCCAIFAAKALQDAGINLKGQLIIQSVIGEEDGGVGTLAAIERGYRADAAIIMEPTELIVAPAQAGALNFRVRVPGFPAHGAMREEGISAIEKFIPIHQVLMDFERERNLTIKHPLFANYSLPYAITVGTLHSGIWASNVPEQLIFEGRFGIAITENVQESRQAFEAVIEQAAKSDRWLRDHPPTVEWWGGQFAPASIPADHAIVTCVQEAYQDVEGHKSNIQGMTYGADMRLLVNDGQIPTLLFGPGDVRNAHQPDEYVPIDDLITVVRTLTLTALRFCGYA